MVPRDFFFIDELRKELYISREESLVSCLNKQVKILNSDASSRKRKALSKVTEILSERDFRWEWKDIGLEGRLEVFTDLHSFIIRYSGGLEVALNAPDRDGKIHYCHCTAGERDLADLIMFIAAVDRKSLELLEHKSIKCHRDQMLSEIEFPSVELETAQFLNPRGIRYNLSQANGHNRLEVQIVNEIWMAKNVTTDSLEDDLRIIPYLLKRPDCIKRDGRGFSIFHKWGWNRK